MRTVYGTLFILAFLNLMASKNHITDKIDCKETNVEPPQWAGQFINKYFRDRHTSILYNAHCGSYFFELATQLSASAIMTSIISFSSKEILHILITENNNKSTETMYVFLGYHDLGLLTSITTDYPTKLLKWVVMISDEQKVALPEEIKNYQKLYCSVIFVSKQNQDNDNNATALFLQVPTYADKDDFCESANMTVVLTDDFEKDMFTQYRDHEDRLFLAKKHFRVAVVESYPYYFQKRDLNSEDKSSAGVDYEIVRVLSDFYDFSYQFVSPEDKTWGNEVNGSWTGMIGMILEKKADFAASEITVSYEREEVIDFTYPYYYDGVGFVTKEPGQKSRAYALVRPFTVQVWMAIFAALFAMSLIVHFVSDRVAEKNWNWLESAWYFFSCLLLQGGHPLPKMNQTRILIAVWWMFAIVVTSSFSGTVTSFIYKPLFHQPIDNIPQLIEEIQAGRYKAGSSMGSAILGHLQEAKQGPMSIIGKQMLEDTKNAIVPATEDPITWILQRQYAFITCKQLIHAKTMIIDEEKFHFSEDQFYTSYFSIAVPENSLLPIYFNKIIFHLTASGLINKWMENSIAWRKIMKMEPANLTLKEQSLHQPLTCTDLIGAFIVLAAGSGAAFIILILEILFPSFKKKIGVNTDKT